LEKKKKGKTGSQSGREEARKRVAEDVQDGLKEKLRPD